MLEQLRCSINNLKQLSHADMAQKNLGSVHYAVEKPTKEALNITGDNSLRYKNLLKEQGLRGVIATKYGQAKTTISLRTAHHLV